MGFDGVASRPRQFRDQGALGAEQGVEERRLAGVRTPRKDHQRAFAKPFAGRRRRQQRVEVEPGGLEQARDLPQANRTIVFFGEVHFVAQQRQQFDQPFAEGGQPP